jgi:hypothetical protein
LLDVVDIQNPIVTFLTKESMVKIKKICWGIRWTTYNVSPPNIFGVDKLTEGPTWLTEISLRDQNETFFL